MVAAVAVTVAAAVPTVPAAAAGGSFGPSGTTLERRHLAHQIQASVRTSFRSHTSATAATAKSPQRTADPGVDPVPGAVSPSVKYPKKGSKKGKAAVKWSAAAGRLDTSTAWPRVRRNSPRPVVVRSDVHDADTQADREEALPRGARNQQRRCRSCGA